MAEAPRAVHAAIERWEEEGLVSPELADRLRAEVGRASEEDSRRLSQYVLAATAAVLLLIAGGVFLDWAWPRMGDGLRAGLLGLAGVGVHLGGSRLEWRRRWVPAAYLMQAAGLGLVLFALGYSEEAWPDLTAPAVGAGVVALAWVVATSVRAIRRSAFMPAVHFVALLAYLALFLERATPLSGDGIVWALDGVLALATVLLVLLLRSDPAGDEHPWALPTFATALYAGLVLVPLTAAGPLELGEDAVYPLDLWLAGVAALTLWGIHRAPEGLRRGWLGHQLAAVVLLWIPLGLWTALEALDGPPEVGLVLVAGAGAAAFLYGDRMRFRRVMTAGALAFVAGTGVWGAERGGALGVVAALALTAGLLFWLSGRWGRGDGPGDAGRGGRARGAERSGPSPSPPGDGVG